MRLSRKTRRELTPAEFNELAEYNSTTSRGVVHTPECAARMAVLQERFNQWNEDQLRADGFSPSEDFPGTWIKPKR